jgi:hypothetical protein
MSSPTAAQAKQLKLLTENLERIVQARLKKIDALRSLAACLRQSPGELELLQGGRIASLVDAVGAYLSIEIQLQELDLRSVETALSQYRDQLRALQTSIVVPVLVPPDQH